MRVQDLGLHYHKQIESVQLLARGDSLWADKATSALPLLDKDFQDTDELLAALHDIQCLHKIYVTELENNQEFYDALAAETFIKWEDFTAPPVDTELQHSLGDKLYNAEGGTDDAALIVLGDGSREIGKQLVEQCIADGVPFVVQFTESIFDPLVLNHASNEHVKVLADDAVEMSAPLNKRIICVSGQAEKEIIPTTEKSHIFNLEKEPLTKRIMSGEMFYTLTILPTPKDAEIDGFDYNDYLELFFEMCDQPWDQIDIAQQKLIKEFNAAKSVRITNSDGTDVSMDIDGFTFANSLIAKNVPGSELFSAPRVDSVNGTVVAKGKFDINNEIIEDLTMVFNNGYLESYTVGENRPAFEKAISIDEGARFVGELGIGTNPHLKQHVANGLLVEKIGGSFHLALGKAYTYTMYEGVPVKVDNGNKSALHWDITTMLHGKDGKIYLDGELVMDHGLWLDESKYAVLNHGWKAIPEDERPEYWREKYQGVYIAPTLGM